jgi:hypothetical protein
MLDRLILKIKDSRHPVRPGGYWDFLLSLRHWWRNCPQLTRCSFCGQSLWWNGPRDPNFPEENRYCSATCAYYGPREGISDEVIPF